MSAKDRREQIIALLNERSYLSVGELSQFCQVSEMTIRRDLDSLEQASRILRTYGGATLVGSQPEGFEAAEKARPATKPKTFLVDRVDVLVATSVNPNYDRRLLQSIVKKNIPLIAESLMVHSSEPVVAVDNYQGGMDLGRWAGHYAQANWDSNAHVLDLTYSLSNTQARSRGFAAGLHETLPNATVILSVDAQSRYAMAYQLTRDALSVYPDINIIFAINDATAWGAINACKDLEIDPNRLIILPFGLEGDTLKGALVEAGYCKAGLAMFPEIVGPTCLEAAIAAYNRQPLAPQLVTPYVILTPETLPDFYLCQAGQWQVRWDTVRARLNIPLNIDVHQARQDDRLPRRIGFIVPFSEHEWYKNLIISMQTYASQLKIDFEVIDADQNLRDEIEMRRQLIARAAAEQIQPGDVVLIDGGPIANALARELLRQKDITVITNSLDIFDILRPNSEVVLVITGGAYRRSSQMLVGPIAEGALRDLRADKLFLKASGVSLNFGLSDTNMSEVTMKQAMIRSAREVILLADYTYFGQESVIQVAPLTVVNKIITDDALPASARLELTKLGLQIMIANSAG